MTSSNTAGVRESIGVAILDGIRAGEITATPEASAFSKAFVDRILSALTPSPTPQDVAAGTGRYDISPNDDPRYHSIAAAIKEHSDGSAVKITNPICLSLAILDGLTAISRHHAATAEDTGRLCTDANVEIAAKAIWAQHMNKLDRANQTSWEDAAPLGRGITLAYAKNALLALDTARASTQTEQKT